MVKDIKLRRLEILLLSLVAFIGLFATVSYAANLTCVVNQSACQAGFTNVLHLSNGTDAHAELPTGNLYKVNVCCTDTEGTNTIGVLESGTAFLRLSNTTDAHVEDRTFSNYNTIVYMSASVSGVSCTNEDVNGACTENRACLATMSNGTDAQAANCTPGAAYTSTVCCKFVPRSSQETTGSSSGSSGSVEEEGSSPPPAELEEVCVANFQCGEWEMCDPDNIQTRTCSDGNGCSGGQTTENQFCNFSQVPVCANGIRDEGETDVDCGGSCGLCGVGQKCVAYTDCASNNCLKGICRDPSVDCIDDEDCGGIPGRYECRESQCVRPEVLRVPAAIFETVGSAIENTFDTLKEAVSSTPMAVKNAVVKIKEKTGIPEAVTVIVMGMVIISGLAVGGHYVRLYTKSTGLRELQGKTQKPARQKTDEAKAYANSLRGFIVDSAAKGYTNTQIKNMLVENGWKENVVAEYVDRFALKPAKAVQKIGYNEIIESIDQELNKLK